MKHGQRGQVTVLAVFFTIGLLAATGLVVDLGMAYLEKSKLQNTADAAVLAGGRELPDTVKASSTATQYVTLNKQSSATTKIAFADSNSKISVNLSKTIPTGFMKIAGINSLTISAKASAKQAGVGGPFDYAIFSGSTTKSLDITGGGWVAKGSVHANHNLNLTGGGFQITQAAEAVKQVKVVGGGYLIGSTVNNSSHIDMPDYSSSIAAAAAACGQVYNGDKNITSGGFTLGSSIHVKGKTNITGGGFSCSGAILSDGDMTITGGGINISGSSQVCFYSKNGNITFTGGGAAFKGVLYAPNGRITITGGGVSFNGCIVAKEIVLTGGGISVNRKDYPITSLPSNHVKLVE